MPEVSAEECSYGRTVRHVNYDVYIVPRLICTVLRWRFPGKAILSSGNLCWSSVVVPESELSFSNDAPVGSK